MSQAPAPPPLAGRNILLVEDESIVALLVEEMLQELGCGLVWHASGVEEALSLLRDCRPDVALLDVNLRGESAGPVAARLDEGHIPFAFATGYGRSGIPPEWALRPVVQKPFAFDELAAVLGAALRSDLGPARTAR